MTLRHSHMQTPVAAGRLAGVLFAGLLCAGTSPAALADPAQPASTAAAATALTLQQCLTDVMHNPNNSGLWSATQDQAQQNVIVTKQEFKPSYSASATGDLSTSPALSSAAADELLGSGERARASLNGTYTLWDGGKRSYDLQTARAGLDFALASNDANALLILQNASYAYYNALWLQQAVDSAQQQVVAAQQNLRDAQTRYSLGTTIRSDVLTANGAVDEAEATLKTQETQAAGANSTLAQLIGADPSQTFQLQDATPPAWTSIDDIGALYKHAEAASPGKRQLQTQVTVDSDKYGSIHADRRPVVSVEGQLGWAAFRDTVPPYDYVYSPYGLISANVTVPLFDEQRMGAREASQQDTIKIDKIAVDQFDRTLRSQVATAVATYKNASDSVGIAQDAFNDASQAYEFARESYQIGKGTQAEVVQALQALAVARDLYNQAVDFRDSSAQSLRWLVGLDTPTNYDYAPASTPAAPGKASVTQVPGPASVKQ